jgi:hypothetical protein
MKHGSSAQTNSKEKSEPKRPDDVKRENSVVKRKKSCKRKETAVIGARVSVVRRPTLKRSDSRSQFHRTFVSDVVTTRDKSVKRSGNCGKLLKYRGISVDCGVRRKTSTKVMRKSYSGPLPLKESDGDQYVDEYSHDDAAAAAAGATSCEVMNPCAVSDADSFDEVDAVSPYGGVQAVHLSNTDRLNEPMNREENDNMQSVGDECFDDIRRNVALDGGRVMPAGDSCGEHEHDDASNSASEILLNISRSRRPVVVGGGDLMTIDRLLASCESPAVSGGRVPTSHPPLAESTPGSVRHRVIAPRAADERHHGNIRRASANDAAAFVIDSDYDSSSSSSLSDVDVSPQTNSCRLSSVGTEFSFCSDKSDYSAVSGDTSSAAVTSSARSSEIFAELDAPSAAAAAADGAVGGMREHYGDEDMPPVERRRVTLPRREKPVAKDGKRLRSGSYVTAHGFDERRSELQRLGSERRVKNLKGMFETTASGSSGEGHADGGCLKQREMPSKRRNAFRMAVSFDCPCSPDDANGRLDDGDVAPSDAVKPAVTKSVGSCSEINGCEVNDGYSGTRPRSFTAPSISRRNCGVVRAESGTNTAEQFHGRRDVNGGDYSSSSSAPSKRSYCILDSKTSAESRRLSTEPRLNREILDTSVDRTVGGTVSSDVFQCDPESAESPRARNIGVSSAHCNSEHWRSPVEATGNECISVIARHKPTAINPTASSQTEGLGERIDLSSNDNCHHDDCHGVMASTDCCLVPSRGPTDGIERDEKQAPDGDSAEQPTMAAFYCHFSQICRSLQTVEIARHKPQQTL